MTAQSRLSRVTVFGGSGFLGRAIVQRLIAEPAVVRIAIRHPERAAAKADAAEADAVEWVFADVRDGRSVQAALDGADAVVNAVGLYVEKGAGTFEAIHARGAGTVARYAAAAGIDRLVHISGIGADERSESAYVRARGKGERAVRDAFARATILRPSVLFGPEDAFVNALAAIARRTPILPLFGEGQTRLQPVFVGDVAAAVGAALTHPDAPGNIYELGGPRIYTYRALIELILEHTKRRRALMPLPFPLWRGLATAASVLPNPPLTKSQVTLMEHDNVVAADALSFPHLGLDPTPLEAVLPDYCF